MRESPPAASSAWTAPTGSTVMKQVIPTELLWGLQRIMRALWASPAVVLKSLSCSAELEAALPGGFTKSLEGLLLKSLWDSSPVVLRSCLLLSLLVPSALR